ncbi:phosphate acetyltransferase, partial [Streptomyces sp. SID11233]|nr:phosphate acetyltransferase [Streptomyces sp. SID11233]
RSEAHNAYRAYAGRGCDVLAMIVNRVAPADRDLVQERLTGRVGVPVYVLPDEPSLSAPTVAQITHTLGGTV